MSGGDYRLQPRYVQAADLVSRLAEFAFRRLSASDQLKQIDEVVSQYRDRHVPLERPAELNVESDEDLRVKTFTKLFSEQLRNFPLLQGDWIPEAFQYYVTFEILEIFSKKEEFFLFKQLGSNDQQELVQKMLDRIKESRCDIDEDILNRLPEESEEDFILRRFTELCNTYPYFLWYDFGKEEAAKYLLNSGKEITQFHHAEIWVGVSRIWFETLSAYEQGEHIAVLTRKLLGDEAKGKLGKLPGESKADFRVRRFKELFEKLEPDSQRYLVGHIRTTLRDDLGLLRPLSADFFDGRSLFDNELIKFVNPNPRVAGGVGRGGATSSAQGGGGGGRQGTSGTTTSAQGGGGGGGQGSNVR
ncbi:hypothetical protein D8674_003368 [Pyrus ussuriensis x Pyrus communis]|uniref:Uncharacterized protein n=1 Tax=Pyrus ussuriensis x Pyrus communis TaxID=2448454 RepID=A0A5N5FHJ1_9ROSA|nr:hypothetical protein D8674_003368 [Pyrus ussuriensis x Pyrus communis]